MEENKLSVEVYAADEMFKVLKSINDLMQNNKYTIDAPEIKHLTGVYSGYWNIIQFVNKGSYGYLNPLTIFG